MAETDDIAIKVEGLSKTFKLHREKGQTVKSAIVRFWDRRRGYDKLDALKGVSFEVKKGEFFGVVGKNGSGKSTLLKLLAGVYTPTNGTIVINGKLTPFIELGVGFNPELTGRENVYLNGALLGFNRKEMAAMYDDIVEFAELERFMDERLKNYSSGMQVRLAFSIAIQANSEILLLDEVLAVGDAAFQKKCFDYFRQLKRDKRTVVFISHDMNSVREYCDRAVLIDKGQIIESGSAEKIAQAYTKMFAVASTANKDHKQLSDKKRWGNGLVGAQNPQYLLTEEMLDVDVVYQFKERVAQPVFGITIFGPSGTKIFESNTKWCRAKTGVYSAGSSVRVHWSVPNIFTNGLNFITLAVADRDAVEFYDWWDEALTFTVDKDKITTAVTMPEFEVKIDAN